MLIDALESCLRNARRKNWDKIYIAVDIHDTIVRGNYKTDELPTEWLLGAKRTLQKLSKRDDIVLILYTCSHPAEIVKYLAFFTDNGIAFSYVNENPEVPDNALGCYTSKMYFNLLLDDKCGFVESEWQIIDAFFDAHPSVSKTSTDLPWNYSMN